ncbi:unnamed protein product [Prorocentrum cordatum]|uniref:Uncharacterized protein n=1 Tax=Prorocentrum cordatum TaxID=2364126 RepID=A0ABN9TIX6_9DINO|nr:unnamed protein product [Polarella glacialis]
MPMLSGVLGRRGPTPAGGRHEVVPTSEPWGAASDLSGLSPRSYDRDRFFEAHRGQQELPRDRAPAGERGAPADVAWEELATLRYTKFTLEGFPGEKHAVFISDRLALNAEAFECICEALGREPPSMALCGLGSACHPACVTTPELRACPAFGSLVAEGRNCLGARTWQQRQRRPGLVGRPGQEPEQPEEPGVGEKGQRLRGPGDGAHGGREGRERPREGEGARRLCGQRLPAASHLPDR